MNTRLTSLIVVSALSSMSAMSVSSVAFASSNSIAVKVQPAAQLPVVVRSRAGLGKAIGKTDAKGRAVVTLGQMANGGKIADYKGEVEECDGGSQQVVVAERGTEPEEGCKKVAGFVVELGSVGIGAATATTIGAGAAAAGLATYFATRGDSAPASTSNGTVTDSKPVTSGTTTPQPQPQPQPTPQPTSPAGTYAVTGTQVSNSGCPLLGGLISEMLAVQDNPTAASLVESGAVSESFSGAIQSNGSFNMHTTGATSGGTYMTTVNGQFNGNRVSYTQTFAFGNVPQCNGAQVVYSMSGNRVSSATTAAHLRR
jgi:hypothetical protein